MSDIVYDYVVIGGGSGGLASARRASGWYNAKVALVEASPRLGGTCVNVGCVPKKVMWNTGKWTGIVQSYSYFNSSVPHVASIAETLRDAKSYGFDVQAKSFDWLALKEKRDAYIARLNGIYEKNLGNDKVDYVKGFASFVDKNTVKVQNGDASTELKAKNILITVGRALPLFTHASDDFLIESVSRWPTHHPESAWC